MPRPTLRQLIMRMSYPGLNNYSTSVNWTTASEALVEAVWCRYAELIDYMDGTEGPFATVAFWDRVIGAEALEASANYWADQNTEKPEPEATVGGSSDADGQAGTTPDAPVAPVVKQETEPELEPEPEQAPAEPDAMEQEELIATPDVPVTPVVKQGPEPEPEPEQGGQARAEPDIMEQEELIATDENGQQIGGNLDEHIEINQVSNIYVKRFGTRARGHELTFRNLDRVTDLHSLLARGIELGLEQTVRDAEPAELIGVQVNSPAMQRPVLVPFRPKAAVDTDKIMHLLESVMQSNTDVAVDDRMTIRTTSVKPTTAGMRTPPFRSNMARFLEQHKKAILKIDNGSDMLCVPRCIIVGMAHAEKDENADKKRHYTNVALGDQNRRTAQKRLAIELTDRAGIPRDRMCGPEEFQLLQQALPNRYRLSILDADRLVQVYSGPQRETTIYLLIATNHCYLVKSMPTLFGTSYFCNHCESGYTNRERHLCPAVCPGCYERPRCAYGAGTSCISCHRTFLSQQCFENHKRDYAVRNNKRVKITPFCTVHRLCPHCHVRLDKGHECGQTKCHICRAPRLKSANHDCYMQKYKKKNKRGKTGTPKFIFFDTECTTDTQISENSLGTITQHIVNTAVSLKVCDDCISDPEADCSNCGTRRTKLQVFFGNNSLDELCKYLFDPSNKDCTVLAHNLKGYDGQFLLKWLDSKDCEPEIVVRGLEVLSLKQDGITFRDTLCFIPFALSAFSKAFGIDIAKGDFPHRQGFNKTENYNAILPQLPDLHYYCPETRNDKAREALQKWHTEENTRMLAQGRVWDFHSEIIRYCKQDVLVLAQAAMKFRRNMLEQTGVDCYNESLTIAGACSVNFRKNHLRPNQIALIPEGGVNREEKQSVIAIKYLKYYAESQDLAAQGQRIQHARNQGEFKVAGYKVDGLLRSVADNRDLRTVFEFNGCCWHGCESCFPNRQQIAPNGQTMGDLYHATMVRQQTIEAAGYQVHVKWEHEVLAELSRNPEMKAFFDACTDVVGPLDPRDSFFGGRVANLHLNFKCRANQKIFYYDVCSLYPYINAYGRYPLGHPEILTEGFAKIDKDNRVYDGIIKCKVLPPRDVFHPVLPYRRADKKLIFALCRTCADTHTKGPCNHTVEERAMIGTYVTEELYAALDDGYEVLQIYEVYHFPTMLQYDRKNPNTALFASYVQWAMTLKVQASGYPPGITTDEQKKKFIDDYKQFENIELDPSKMEYNASLRSLAKLCANSFWGKFGQRSDTGSVKYFTEPSDFYTFVYDPTVEVQAIRICSDNKLAVTYKKQNDFVEAPGHVSVTIASWTTAQARLKLLSYLRPLGRRALYYDTDSVIFVVDTNEVANNPNYYMPPVGCYLGVGPDRYGQYRHLICRYRNRNRYHQVPAVTGTGTEVSVGPYLGELTDELSDYGENSYCTHLIAAGPKVYSMQIWSTKSKSYVYSLKIRGFTVNSEVAKKLNFQSLKTLVENFLETGTSDLIPVEYNRIGRNRDRTVISFKQQKSYKIVCDKVRVLRSGCTLPFGYTSE